MKLSSRTRTVITVISILPLWFASAGSRADEQVLSQGIVSGQSALGSGVVEPNFLEENRPPAYGFFIDPDTAADFRVVEFGEGSINVLDGDVLRKFDATGNEIIDNAFPVLCTNILVEETKNNGQIVSQSLSSCTRTLTLPDGTFRIFGADKGKKLVVYKYDASAAGCTIGWDPATDSIDERFCAGELVVNGAPPQAAEAVADSNENTGSRAGAADAYWLIADKSSVYLGIPGDEGEADSLERVARINGKNLTGVAPFGTGRVIVADDDGMLYELTNDGSSTWSVAQWTAAAFGPSDLSFPDGNRTEQNIKLKNDANEELLYISNRAKGTIHILGADGLAFQSLYLDSTGGTTSDFFPNDIDVIGAIIGTWDECTTSNEGLCQIGQQVDEAYVQGVVPRTADGGANTFVGKKFVLQDCRWVDGTLPAGIACPVTNCEDAGDLTSCDLDVIALALLADPTFADLLPDPRPVSVLPRYLRADLDYPPSGAPQPVDDVDLVDNQGTFFYYHIDTGSAFENLATTTYDIDIIRDNLVPATLPDGGSELCPNPLEELSAADLNEQTNMTAYLPDRYQTVRCSIDDPGVACEFDRSAIVMVSSCNSPRKSPTWGFSGHVVGVEAAFEEVDTFRRIASLQNAELQAFKDQVLCADPFDLPDADGNPVEVGPILPDMDCAAIQSDLNQIDAKWITCGSASNPSQGASAENCNALNTHIANLEDTIGEASWPLLTNPTDPVQFLLADFNPRGQFTGRLQALSYSVNNWWLTSNAAPLVKITSPANGDTIAAGTSIVATADDLEDGDLTGLIVWSVNDVPSPTTGGTLSTSVLPAGDYTFTAAVTDGDGITDSASITVTITAP